MLMQVVGRAPGAYKRASQALEGTMRHILITAVALLLAGAPAGRAQSSASFRLGEHAINAGGNPAAGVVLSSPSFRLTLDSLGDAVSAGGLASASFGLDACFSAAYAPPREVQGFDAADADTLVWDPERAAGTYNLYRDLIGGLPAFGACHLEAITGTAADDPAVPPPGDAFFYLVTVESRLAEEGTKGFGSDGTERLGTMCP